MGPGFLLHIVPLSINPEKLSESLEEAIISSSTLVASPNAVILSLESESEMEAWANHILQSSALFMVEHNNRDGSPEDEAQQRKKIALLVQESIRSPGKLLRESDLAHLQPGRQIDSNNETICSSTMVLYTEQEQSQMVRSPLPRVNLSHTPKTALELIHSAWVGKKLRRDFQDLRKASCLLQKSWKAVKQRRQFECVVRANTILQTFARWLGARRLVTTRSML